MLDRRRADRVCIANGIAGVISVRQDVLIESLVASELTVVSEAPMPRGEQVTLEIDSRDGIQETCSAKVVDRSSVLVNGRACHRLSLRAQTPPRFDLRPRRPRLHGPLPAVTVRRVDVRLLNISPKGCLLRSPDSLAEGTIGLLDVSINGHAYADGIRVSRATSVHGGVGYRSAGQFLSIAPPSVRSMRWLAEWLGKGALAQETAAVTVSWEPR